MSERKGRKSELVILGIQKLQVRNSELWNSGRAVCGRNDYLGGIRSMRGAIPLVPKHFKESPSTSMPICMSANWIVRDSGTTRSKF